MASHSFSFISFLNLFCVPFSKVFSCFPGKMSYLPTDDPENPEEFFEGLSCGEVAILGNFSLSSDDPRNYNDKIPLISQNRQFPDEAYPAGADPDPLTSQAVGAPSSAGQPSTSAGGAAQPQPGLDPAIQQLHETLISHHQNIVKMCQRIGLKDVCAIQKKSKLENLLQSIDPGDFTCKVCKKGLSSKDHLKNHLKAKHFGKTNHQCDQCQKYYSDASSLKVHQKSHDPSAKKFTCGTCQKVFTTKSRLTEHLPVHGSKQHVCQFCGKKSFRHIKGVREHEETCPQNPKAKEFYCRLCQKKLGSRRALQRHMKLLHDGAPMFSAEEEEK